MGPIKVYVHDLSVSSGFSDEIKHKIKEQCIECKTKKKKQKKRLYRLHVKTQPFTTGNKGTKLSKLTRTWLDKAWFESSQPLIGAKHTHGTTHMSQNVSFDPDVGAVGFSLQLVMVTRQYSIPQRRPVTGPYIQFRIKNKKAPSHTTNIQQTNQTTSGMSKPPNLMQSLLQLWH